mmetsp:Transcript_17147/g.47124  ORF Transcript_17147/g.47124 Transcript_17147/m.47124 type:complete len:506 (+) Transcript_17147:368-1885(+)
MFRLDALAGGAGADEGGGVAAEPGPPDQAAGEGEGLVAAEVPPERRRMELGQDLGAQPGPRRDAEAVPAGAPTVQQPVPPPETGAGGWGGRGGSVGVEQLARTGASRAEDRGELGVAVVGCGEGRPEGGREEPGPVRGADRRQHGRTRGGGRRKEFLRACRVSVTRRNRGALAVGEALPRQAVGRVGPPRDVDHGELVLGEDAEPPGLVRADGALALEPLQARVVGVQLEGLVHQIGPQCLERMDDRQQFQHVGGVRALRGGELAGLVGHRAKGAGGVGLLQDGRDSELGGIRDKARGPPGCPELEDRGRRERRAKMVEGRGLSRPPPEARVGAAESGEGGRQAGEARDETAIEVGEAHEAPHVGAAGRRGPVAHRRYLSGVGMYAGAGEDVAQEQHRRPPKLALARLGEELVVAEHRQHHPYVHELLGVDADVVHVHLHEAAQHRQRRPRVGVVGGHVAARVEAEDGPHEDLAHLAHQQRRQFHADRRRRRRTRTAPLALGRRS